MSTSNLTAQRISKTESTPISIKSNSNSKISQSKSIAKVYSNENIIFNINNISPTSQNTPIGSRKISKQDSKKIKKSPSSKDEIPRRTPSDMMADNKKALLRQSKQLEKQKIPQRKAVERTVELFSHLEQPDRSLSITANINFSQNSIHPAILKLGAQLSRDAITGSNAQSVALLSAFVKFIDSYKPPENKDITRESIKAIEPCINFLKQCRPLSLSLRNTITHMKFLLKSIPIFLEEDQAKAWFRDQVKKFVNERIILASKIISEKAGSRIKNHDVILVYSPCFLVMRVLQDAFQRGIQFRVVVIDSRPDLSGRCCIHTLSNAGIDCTYMLMSGLTFAIKDCTKVLVSVEALLTNGCVLARIGTSMICLVAKTYNVPVMVCCEAFKFTDRVQTDSIVYNELGDPYDIVRIPSQESSILQTWSTLSSLWILNLKYDITPPKLVDVVITESGMLPLTSIPVIIRVQANLERLL